MTKKKKVYALLAGINDYRQPIPKLRGCLHDVAQVKSYLEQTEELDPVFSVLLDKEATKAAIVDGILNFLGKAQSGEVALFYFSGHGTREKAPEVFWASDPDRKLQCLVPYDGIEENKSGPKYNLLANKELRYLINKISENNSHVLTLFDCCHSGGASRNAGGATPRQFIPRFLAGESFPERKWSDFVFSGELSSSRFQSESIKTLLPEGPHIHLAAALPEESAYETDGSGVFTRNLLDLLRRTGNRITYVDLQSLIRNSVKSNFRQTPQVYAGGGQTVFRFFMDLMPMGEGNLINKGEEPFGLMANVNYNKTLGWQMDMGRLQGVSDTQTQIKVESKKGQKDFIALPVKIGPDYTLLKFEGTEPDQSESYLAFLPNSLSSPIRVFLRNWDEDQSGLTFMEEKFDGVGPGVFRVDMESEADYVVQIKEQTYSITFPEDDKRPLTALAEPYSPHSARQIVQFLTHISRWEFVKNLHNPNGFLFQDYPIKVEFIRSDGTAIEIRDDQIILDYEQIDGEYTGKFKIKLTNQFHQRLFVSFLYLSLNFEVYTELLPQGSIGLDPGHSAWIAEGDFLELEYEAQVEHHNWKYSITYFKLIANTAFNDISKLQLGALPSPMEGISRAGRADRARQTQPNANDWITRLLCLKLRNPKYVDTES